MIQPLEGVKVVDFTQAYSGPYCTLNLADYGARVIKVERKDVGDQSRYWGPYNDHGYSGYFALYNRNKESIAVDMKTEEGVKIIKKLYQEADVVIENFKFGTLDKMGLGYEAAKEINPTIIFASITGFGQNGPMHTHTCYDNIAESVCGFMEMTGLPEMPPLRSGASVADSYTGLMMALAIAIAYYHRIMTGEGKRLDVAMLDSMFATIDNAILTYGLKGRELTRSGNAKPEELTPYDLYRCKDGWFAAGIAEESMWEPYCRALGCEDLVQHPNYRTNDLRCRNNAAFTEIMRKVFADKTLEELADLFREYRLPGVACITPLETMQHPHMLARDMVIDIADKGLGMTYKAFGIPVKFSETPGSVKRGAPLLGEDTISILRECGYTETEIEVLLANQVVGAV